jgi:peptidoglycan/LPS O-acetylase OafA/YrhL
VPSGQLRSLTSLRFFAAASIVVFHMLGMLIPGGAAHSSLALGVSFFFVLSGFVLTYAHWTGELDLKRFYRARFARLWPLHLFAAMAWWLVMQGGDPASSPWVWPALLNVLLLQAWVPAWGVVFAMNGVAWSISVEVFFYLLFPLLRGKWLWPIVVAGTVATAAWLFALDLLAPPVNPPWPTPAPREFWSLHAALQFPLVRLLEFCVGVAAAKWFMVRRLRSNTALEVIALLAVVAFAWWSEPLRAALSSAGWSHVGVWASQSGGMLVFAFAIFVFAHQAGALSRVLQVRALVLLGEISFSTYMLHYVVLMVFVRAGVSGVLSPLALAGAYLATTYVVSYLSWRFVEKPSKRFIEGGRWVRRVPVAV